MGISNSVFKYSKIKSTITKYKITGTAEELISL